MKYKVMTKNITIEDIKNFDSQISEIDKQMFLLQDKGNNLEQEQGHLIGQYILQNNLFKDTEWKLKSHGTALEYADAKNTTVFLLLKEIIGNNARDLLIGDGFELYYADGLIVASFDKYNMIPEFAKQFQLKINGSEITDRLGRINKDIENLIDLCHLFNLQG